MAYDAVACEFTKVFPTCPICGSDSGYDATRKFLTYYVRCRSCGAVWQCYGSLRRRIDKLLLVEPDKDMRASSLVRKGERWHGDYGYKVEFWKSLDLGGLKRGEEHTAPPSQILTDLEDEVLNYIDKYGGEISVSKACEELGLSEDRLKATIDKLKKKGYVECTG